MSAVPEQAQFRIGNQPGSLADVVGAVLGFAVANRVLDFLVNPYCEAKQGEDCRLLAIDPLEGFTTRIKIALFVGAVVAAPVILWQVWRFVTPALHKNEKRYAIPFIVFATLFFIFRFRSFKEVIAAGREGPCSRPSSSCR